MLRRSKALAFAVVVLVLVTQALALNVISSAYAQGGPPPPNIELEAKPPSQDVQAGGFATFTIDVSTYPDYEWTTGNVTFSLVGNNPPQGLSVIFDPESLTNVTKPRFSSTMIVRVAEDAPLGYVTITVKGEGIGHSDFFGSYVIRLYSNTSAVLNIVPASQKITVTTTVTTTTIRLTTNTYTPQVTDSLTYALAVSATVAALVLAVVVLLLQRRTK